MPETPGPYERILAVTGAACAAIATGRVSDLRVFAEHRASLVAMAPPATAADAEALRRVLELDRRLADHVAAERRRLANELARLNDARHTLASYRGHGARSPIYFERLG